MYKSFFGLRERPFDLVPDPRFLFLAGSQQEALSSLRYGLTVPRGLTLLLGEAGTGKTTLVQAVLSEMAPDSVQCVLLSNPTLTRAEFYEFLADGFGLGATAGRSKTRFLGALRRHLEARHARGRLTALLIDEAQSLPDQLLEEVRLLSNLETATTKLLNVVLAGQQELADRLNQPGLRQLKQRISLRCELTTFDAASTAAYVAGRLRIAGGLPVDIFTPGAVELVHQASGGVPRVINVICDNALIGGFAAQTRPVPSSIVQHVARDFDFSTPDAATATDVSVPGPALPEPPFASMAPAPVSDSWLGLFTRRRRFSFFDAMWTL